MPTPALSGCAGEEEIDEKDASNRPFSPASKSSEFEMIGEAERPEAGTLRGLLEGCVSAREGGAGAFDLLAFSGVEISADSWPKESSEPDEF